VVAVGGYLLATSTTRHGLASITAARARSADEHVCLVNAELLLALCSFAAGSWAIVLCGWLLRICHLLGHMVLPSRHAPSLRLTSAWELPFIRVLH
jgi:hypothetical protein